MRFILVRANLPLLTACQYGQTSLDATSVCLLGGCSVLATPEAAENIQVEGVSKDRARQRGGTWLLHWFLFVYVQCPTTTSSSYFVYSSLKY